MAQTYSYKTYGTITITEREGNLARIMTSDGTEFWVPAAKIKTHGRPDKQQAAQKEN